MVKVLQHVNPPVDPTEPPDLVSPALITPPPPVPAHMASSHVDEFKFPDDFVVSMHKRVFLTLQ